LRLEPRLRELDGYLAVFALQRSCKADSVAKDRKRVSSRPGAVAGATTCRSASHKPCVTIAPMLKILVFSALVVGFVTSLAGAFACAPNTAARRDIAAAESVAAVVPECHEDAFIDSKGRTIGTVPHCGSVPVAAARSEGH